jgi:hypothetical protein
MTRHGGCTVIRVTPTRICPISDSQRSAPRTWREAFARKQARPTPTFVSTDRPGHKPPKGLSASRIPSPKGKSLAGQPNTMAASMSETHLQLLGVSLTNHAGHQPMGRSKMASAIPLPRVLKRQSSLPAPISFSFETICFSELAQLSYQRPH